MLALLDYSLISVTRVEVLPRSFSKQNQLRTLINMSRGRWYPIRLSKMRGVFQFRPLCWHSSLLGKCVLIHTTAHNTLIIHKQHEEPDHTKGPNRHRALRGRGSPIREHKNIILKWLELKI